MLRKNELIQELSALADLSKSDVRAVLDNLAMVAKEEIEAGCDFTVPDVCKISFGYTTPYKKGDKYVNPITKEEGVRDKSRPAKLRIKASANAKIKNAMPGINTKAGKAVVARKTPKKK